MDVTGTYYINLDTDYATRFSAGKFMRFTDNSDPLSSLFFNSLIQLPVAGSYLVVQNEGRPDVISFYIYGSTQYWWELMFYNTIMFPWYIPTGTILNYPSLASLENFYFQLKAEQLKNE